MKNRPTPSAVCLKCHKAYDVRSVGGKCGRAVDIKDRCGGTIQAAMSVGDWEACPSCIEGRKDGTACAQCSGDGWLYVRA